MKKATLFLLLFLQFELQAQSDSVNTGHGFGFQLSQYQQDFGFGLQYASPLMFQGIGLRAKANFMFNQHLIDSVTTWSPYSNLSLGIVGIGGMVGKSIRIYGEGGLLLILPSRNFSSQSSTWGGYGLFGFEFFNFRSFNYFIEIGGVGTGAIADKVPGKPIYSNGLSISVGFRVIL